MRSSIQNKFHERGKMFFQPKLYKINSGQQNKQNDISDIIILIYKSMALVLDKVSKKHRLKLEN